VEERPLVSGGWRAGVRNVKYAALNAPSRALFPGINNIGTLGGIGTKTRAGSFLLVEQQRRVNRAAERARIYARRLEGLVS
jgi:hypothetical protein